MKNSITPLTTMPTGKLKKKLLLVIHVTVKQMDREFFHLHLTIDED